MDEVHSDSDFETTHEKHWSNLTDKERKQTITDAYLMTTNHKYVEAEDKSTLKKESILYIQAV